MSAHTSRQIAEKLVELGHQITVIAPFPSRPEGKTYPNYSWKFIRRELTASGVNILRCLAFPSSKSTIFSRLLENLSFGLSAALALASIPRQQVIYANTWPLLATGLVATFARLRGIPIVISVQDVYPESLFSQKRISKENVLARALIWIDKKISLSASALIVLAEQFKELYNLTRNVAVEKIHVVPNWIDPEWMDFQTGCKTDYRRKMGLPANAFCYVYAGNIGAAAGLEEVILTFKQLEGINVCLVIAGSGSHLRRCQYLVQDHRLNQIFFHSPWLESETVEILELADAFILPTRGKQSLSSVPSKLITYMFAGRPIIAVADIGSEVSRVIEAANCGRVLTANSSKEIGDALIEFSQLSSNQLDQLGESGKYYAKQHFNQKDNLSNVIHIILNSAIDHELAK